MILFAEENNLNDLTREGFCIVDFFSDTCGPCKLLIPILNRLESEFPFIKIIKVNTSTYPSYKDAYEITAVPTLLFMNEGTLKERHVGVLNSDQLKERISTYLYE